MPGSDLVLTLPEAAADAGLSVFLLGGNPGVPRRRCEPAGPLPRLGDVGFYCPPFGFEDDADEMDRIRRTLSAARPDLVLVGLGFPKQERVIRVLRDELPQRGSPGSGSRSASSQATSHAPRSSCSGSDWSGYIGCTSHALFRATSSRASRSARGCCRGHWRVASAAQPSGL